MEFILNIGGWIMDGGNSSLVGVAARGGVESDYGW